MEKSKQSGDAVPQGVYRRSMNRSRLVFTSKELTPDAFAMHMLEANHIPGILESTFSYMDSSMQQSFDVTSHQPLTAFEHRLSHADMIRIWEGVLALTSELDRYLLDGRHLLLQPEYLFFGGKKRQLKACYIPFFERGLPEQLEELAEYALAQAFPEDRRAIVLAYRVRNAAAGGELDMAELRRILLEEEADLREEEPPEEETYSRFPEEQKEQKKRSSGKMLTAAVRLTLFPEKATVTAALAAAMAFLAMYAIRHRRALSTDLPFLLGLGALTAVLLLVSAVNRWREHAAERAAGVGNEKKGAGRAARETDLPEAAYLQPPVLPARGDGRSMLLADPGKDDFLPPREDGSDYTIQLPPSGGASPDLLRLVPEGEGEILFLECRDVLIGKSPELADFCIADPAVSRVHAKISYRDGRYYLRDLGSRNGTCIGEHLLVGNEERQVAVGDLIRFAECRYRTEVS